MPAATGAKPIRNELFRRPTRVPLIAPSILSADFARLGAECRAVLDAGGDLLHIDVMDGHFVPNLSMGPAICAAVRKACPETFLDVHLMVTDPGAFLEPFAEAGADHCTFHVEAVADPPALAARAHELGMTVGLACNPDARVDRIEPFVSSFDLILCMSVFPGFSGQAFIPQVLETCRAVKTLLRPDQRLEIDGGVAPETAPMCRAAGCDVLVAASAIFRRADYADAIRRLRS